MEKNKKDSNWLDDDLRPSWGEYQKEEGRGVVSARDSTDRSRHSSNSRSLVVQHPVGSAGVLSSRAPLMPPDERREGVAERDPERRKKGDVGWLAETGRSMIQNKSN
ncbi:hypothetical protein AALO_G00297720 [Alosa alosa]|uniref:Uncharacterized protein n=1 Tax=Alosa alosa TaxID=278164 RepID=A0AAV6FDQ9_9TELE|nr:hypothetical protein AALO_G00297720 [Alosa alosa]